MPFPEAQRVIYKRNSLNKVICQLRFAPILRIETETPSNFQEDIKSQFPFFNERTELQQQTEIGIMPQSPIGQLQQLTKTAISKNYEFLSEDKKTAINLTRTFISISTKEYSKWENFLEMFNPAIQSFIKIYSPLFYTRVGLRYINIIDRNFLGLNDVSWLDLLNNNFIGLLSSNVIADKIKQFENVYEINLSDNKSIARISTTFVRQIEQHNNCLMIDSDFYYPEKLNIAELSDKLNYLHTHTTKFIQWVITEKLHNAMEPELL